MVYTLTDHIKDVKMFKIHKWNHQPQLRAELFLRKSRGREREKKKSRHHDVISMVCTLIEHSSRLISAREICQLL